MCIGTITVGGAIALGSAAGMAGAGIYGANKQAGSAHDAMVAQSWAQNHAATLQSESDANALAYTKEQAAQARIDADVTQHGNYDQWRAAQVYQNDTSAARARNINALGAQYGVAPRDIPEMAIPDYRSTIGGAAAGPDGATAQQGAPASGSGAAWWNPQDPQGSLQTLLAGKAPTSQTLLALKPQFDAAGIQISPPNAEGVTSKINIPGVGWTRVLNGGVAGGQGTGWTYVVQPGGAPAVMAASAPGTVGAAGLAPTALPTAAATPPIAPALTIAPYQRRTVRDYFAA